MIATSAQLQELLPKLQPFDRIAVDTEADSLHSYFEKLCLLQISIPEADFLVDPLTGLELQAIAEILAQKEIVLQGADFDLRLMRRSFGLEATRVFDTVIAARMLGLREFSLAALVERYFAVTLVKESQKANWGRRPLPDKMKEYAKNDTHYLLPLAEKMETELVALGRMDWFRQSCARGLEMTKAQRTRSEDEVWRIAGSGLLRGKAAAILRELWRWRDSEARAVDRPPFHIMHNSALLTYSRRFMEGEAPKEVRGLSPRRSRGFFAAADRALQMPESEWPVIQHRVGVRPTRAMERRTAELRERRDLHAHELGLEPAFIAPRAALEAIAMDETRADALLVPWQKQLLGLS